MDTIESLGRAPGGTVMKLPAMTLPIGATTVPPWAAVMNPAASAFTRVTVS